MRVVLTSAAVGPHLELLELTEPTLVRFAERHGWDLVLHRRELAPGRPPSWGKVVALHDLAGAYERVVWVDADAVVVDGRADLAAVLAPTKVLGVAVHRVGASVLPNLGVAVLRGGRPGQRLAERLWACTDLVHHPWWENAALLRLIGYRTFEPVGPERPTALRLRLQELDPSWNSIPVAPSARPKIVHLAGEPHDVRLRELGRLAAAIADAPGVPRPLAVR